LTAGFAAAHLLADRGYDTNAIVEQAQQHNTKPVIPPRKHRTEQRAYDQYLYKLRHLVENAFLQLKGWRGIATRYAKRTASYLAAVQIRCIFRWTQIL
jgi:transposase